MVKIERIVFGFMAAFAAIVAYAMDWQREQDEQMAGFRELIVEQKTLLKLQQEYQKNQLPPDNFSAPKPYFDFHTIPLMPDRQWSNLPDRGE